MHNRSTSDPPVDAYQGCECSSLVSRAFAGDASAFDAIVARHRASAYR
jgi:hypothetical protein